MRERNNFWVWVANELHVDEINNQTLTYLSLPKKKKKNETAPLINESKLGSYSLQLFKCVIFFPSQSTCTSSINCEINVFVDFNVSLFLDNLLGHTIDFYNLKKKFKNIGV